MEPNVHQHYERSQLLGSVLINFTYIFRTPSLRSISTFSPVYVHISQAIPSHSFLTTRIVYACIVATYKISSFLLTSEECKLYNLSVTFLFSDPWEQWSYGTLFCRSHMDSNLVFFLTKSYWPQYHYMLPWDYQTGEYGNYGKGCTSTFIRVWAAMGWATDLHTVDVSSIRNALLTAVQTKKPVAECLFEADNYSKQYNEKEQFLNLSKTL